MNEDLRSRLRRSMTSLAPRLPGQRSEVLAQRILAIPEKQRTFLQRRMLEVYEQGDCIGCNQQGNPLGIDGKELPVACEPNGFAAPIEFCDCADGVRFQRRIERQRKEYTQQNIRSRQMYVQRLFGLSSITPPLTQEITLDTWPIVFIPDDTIDDDTYMREVEQRRVLVELVRYYADHLQFESPEGLRRGFCLTGWPGVGKTGLIRSIEPLFAKSGHFMLSLFVPELLRLLRHAEQIEEMLRIMRMVEILFLDDLGNPLSAGPISAEVHGIFACVFEERLKYNRPTLITTNLDEDALEAQFGEYILSRIHGLCYVYFVPGTDLR